MARRVGKDSVTALACAFMRIVRSCGTSGGVSVACSVATGHKAIELEWLVESSSPQLWPLADAEGRRFGEPLMLWKLTV
ncbi:hypothetical protein XI08_10975 [Bradyrhizobium sp. CCBAU 11361]|nr:hypothetical protein [Bradyrhizobium sp. CCBAU 11361]